MTNIQPVYKILGRAIKGKREKAKLTQVKFAKVLGKSREWLASIEQGKQRILVHDLLDIEMALRLRGDRGSINSRINLERLQKVVGDVVSHGVRSGNCPSTVTGMIMCVIEKELVI